MSYPKQLAKLRPVRGFISDTPAHEVGPDYYTTMANVITRGGFAQRLPAQRSVYETALATAAPGQLLHAVNAEFSGNNYWLLFEDDGTAWAIESTNATQIDAGLLQAVSSPERFSSTLLNGVPVISNAIDEPVFWNGTVLATLPAWTATESCKFIAAFQYHLFALDISNASGEFPSLLRWSAAAEPGTIANTWTPDASNDAGDVELSDSPGELLCAVPMRDSLMIYKPSATYQARFVEDNNVFIFRKVHASSGALTRRSVCDVNGQHLVVTDGDIILTDGTNRRSIGEARIKDWVFNQLSQENFSNLFCIHSRGQNEVLIGIPSGGSEFCNIALVYNIEFDTFGVRDFFDIAHAASGLINDTVESRKWGDNPGVKWGDSPGVKWASSDVNLARDSMVLIREGELQQQDASGSQSLTAYLGKYSMAFGDAARVKFVRRVHVRATGYNTLYVRVGGQMTPTGSVTWSNEVAIVNPDQIANCFATGRYISVQIRSADSAVWKVTGVDLELEMRGYH